MKKISIYLDTSIINFLFADDAPEKRDITLDFFENYIQTNKYDVCISPVVIDEINKTTCVAKRDKLLDVIRTYQIKIVDISGILSEVNELAERYISTGAIPAKKLEDALHIAIATVLNIDVLLSWNYKHLANINRARKITGVNIFSGYSEKISITTPLEVFDE